MSISIYAMNYGNRSVMNKESGIKSAAEATNEENMKTAELQQSTEGVRVTETDIREDGTVSLVQNMQGTEAARTDKAEISQEGRIASAKMQQAASANTIQADEGSDETASSDIGSEIVDLSEYTDTELKQMYYRGEITLQEYEDETGETIE